jgi:hypothetical protein
MLPWVTRLHQIRTTDEAALPRLTDTSKGLVAIATRAHRVSPCLERAEKFDPGTGDVQLNHGEATEAAVIDERFIMPPKTGLLPVSLQQGSTRAPLR